MADSVVGRAYWELRAEDDRLRADLRSAETQIRASGKKGADAYDDEWKKGTTRVKERIGGVTKALAAVGIGIGISTVLTFFGGAIDAASDLNEEVSKSEVVFGAAAARVQEWGTTTADSMGQAQSQALGAAGAFGNMFKTIGFADDAAADMSMRMVTLASDMGSFNNQDPSEMLERLRSGLSGEAEPLRQFGVLISEARVKQKAYEIGLAEAGAELTEQQKVVARYNLILQDTALQQGDFARTSTGLANSQRIASAQMQDALADIGQELLPLAKAVTQFAVQAIPAAANALKQFIRAATPVGEIVSDLAGLYLEHVDKILPLLVMWMGVRLVGAMRAATTAATLLKLASLSLRSALFLGVPALLEGSQALGDWIQDLTMGKEAAEDFRTAVEGAFGGNEILAAVTLRGEAERLGTTVEALTPLVNEFAEKTGGNFEELMAAANDLGRDWRALARNAIEAAEESGEAWDEFIERVQNPPVADASGYVPTESQIAAATAGVAAAISAPFEKGADDAVAAVDNIYTEIATKIAARESQLAAAGGDAIAAWFEPSLVALKSRELERAIAASNEEIAELQRTGTVAQVEEAQARRIGLIQEMWETQIAAASIGTDMEQQAAQSALRTSDFMLNGLASRDPEIRAFFQGLDAELARTTGNMETTATTAGKEVPKKLATGLDAGRPAIIKPLAMIQGELVRGTSLPGARASGAKIGSDLGAGLWDSIPNLKLAVDAVGRTIAGPLALSSEPKDHASPLYGHTRWMGTLVRDMALDLVRSGPLLYGPARGAAGVVRDGLGLGEVPIPLSAVGGSPALAAASASAVMGVPRGAAGQPALGGLTLNFTYAPGLSTASPAEIEHLRRELTPIVVDGLARAGMAERPPGRF